jgi:hypothetical protein
MVPRDVIQELRNLRDAGYIRGFVSEGDRCTVLLAEGHVSAGESDLRKLIARVKLIALVADGIETAAPHPSAS